MFAATGAAAGLLATAIIAIAAEPAAADPAPVLPLPAVQHVPDLLPGHDRTTESAVGEASAAPSAAAPPSTTKISTKTGTKTTGETVRKTKASRPSTAAHQPASRHASTPMAAPKLRRAAPDLPPVMAEPGIDPPDRRGDWLDLVPIANFVLLAVALTVAAVRSRRRPSCGEAPANRRAVGVVRAAFPPGEYGPARPGTWSDTLRPPVYETARILPRGDDGGFAEEFLEGRFRS